ncbi:hypothetical protein BLNAU_22252 [Blattamonas nauphoetae]|uniref:Uncharacterized protein n=1 Tax=Blattamonas nauphoetae TaxID=2049346 RepID=A0ABQ9WU43_9EUKA|nr:hypothetical protein BLNAU_22252 [Blattamonas nauphoetae]
MDRPQYSTQFCISAEISCLKWLFEENSIQTQNGLFTTASTDYIDNKLTLWHYSAIDTDQTGEHHAQNLTNISLPSFVTTLQYSSSILSSPTLFTGSYDGVIRAYSVTEQSNDSPLGADFVLSETLTVPTFSNNHISRQNFSIETTSLGSIHSEDDHPIQSSLQSANSSPSPLTSLSINKQVGLVSATSRNGLIFVSPLPSDATSTLRPVAMIPFVPRHTDWLSPDVFIVSGDSSLVLCFDRRSSLHTPVNVLNAASSADHRPSSILSQSFNYLTPFLLCTGLSNGELNMIDLRASSSFDGYSPYAYRSSVQTKLVDIQPNTPILSVPSKVLIHPSQVDVVISAQSSQEINLFSVRKTPSSLFRTITTTSALSCFDIHPSLDVLASGTQMESLFFASSLSQP